MKGKILSACILGTFLMVPSWDASACSVVWSCIHELDVDDKLPAQAEGVVWNTLPVVATPEELRDHVTLRELDGEMVQELEVEVQSLEGSKVLIVPKTGFQAERTYELDVTLPEGLPDSSCQGDYEASLSRSFSLHTITGTPPGLTAGEVQRGPYSFPGGSECVVEEEAAFTTITMQWPSSFEEVREALEVEILVDGERRYPPQTGDSFTLAATCEETSRASGSFSEGDHEVITRFKIPGTSISWDSEPLTVSLRCQGIPGEACNTSPAPTTPPTTWLLLGLGFLALRLRAFHDRKPRQIHHTHRSDL